MLIEESLIVAVVSMVFLLHVRSAFVAIITLPLGILISYICMHALGLSSNIMSLGGIAIAIGAMIDAALKTKRRRPFLLSTMSVSFARDCATFWKQTAIWLRCLPTGPHFWRPIGRVVWTVFWLTHKCPGCPASM